MEEQPWWVYACQFTIWVCSIALLGMMVAYVMSTYQPELSFGWSLVVFVSLFVAVGLVASIALIRRLRGESGGWLGVVADLFFRF